MSLRWDTNNCPAGPWPGESGSDEDWGWLQGIIFTMPAVHMSTLEVDEFIYRTALLVKLGWLSQPYPLEHVERWAGMTVNVVPLTRARFHNLTWRNFTNELERSVNRELRQARS